MRSCIILTIDDFILFLNLFIIKAYGSPMLWLNLIVQFISGTIVTAPSLWFSGKTIVGEDKAKFSDAFLITMLGILVKLLMDAVFIEGIFVSLIQLVIWLYLVRRYFETDLGKAFLISVISVIVSFVITLILTILGLGLTRI